MSNVKKKWDSYLAKEKKKSVVESIITFFYEERGEEIGIIAAEDVLDFFLEEVGAEIYDKGVQDSREVLKNRFEDLEVDLEMLRQGE